MDRERLIKAIMKCFKEFEGDHGVNPDGGGSWWTKEIKTRLCKIGKLWRSHRYRITATGEDADAELIEPSRLPVR